jgi:hypothetical protein
LRSQPPLRHFGLSTGHSINGIDQWCEVAAPFQTRHEVLVFLRVLALGKYSLWLLVSIGSAFSVSNHDIKDARSSPLPKSANAFVASILVALSIRGVSGIGPRILDWINVLKRIALLIQLAGCFGNTNHRRSFNFSLLPCLSLQAILTCINTRVVSYLSF